ncbi:MAG: mechanosensitive ion channel domain-containing protein [Bacteroidota bacterium]
MNIHNAGRLLFFSFLYCFLGIAQPAHAQNKPRKLHKLSDSVLIKANTDTAVSELINKIESYTYTIDHTNFLIKNQIDVTPIATELIAIDKRLEGFKSRFEKKGAQMNLRSINSSTILLKEIAGKLTGYQANLGNYSKELSQSNKEVKKIINDPILRQEVGDSVLKDQIEDILDEGKSLDSAQLQTLSRVNLILNHVSISLLQADDIVSDMGYLSIAKKSSMWGVEEKPLFQATPSDYHQSLLDSCWQTLQRSAKIISIYLTGKWNILVISLLLFIFITTWSLSNIYRIKKSATAEETLEPVHLLRRSVLLGCLMGFFTYTPFLFANPPMSFLHCIELLRLICLSFLLFPFLTGSAKKTWIFLSILWIYYAQDDLLLESAFAERWALLLAGVALIIICLRLIISSKELFVKITQSSATKGLVIFSLAQVILSVVLNITGRLTLAKILGVSAIQCLMLGVSLQIFCIMILEAIYMQTEAFSKTRFSDLIDFKALQVKLKTVLWIIASVVWIISLLRNYTMYDGLIKEANLFFNQQRSIGNMAFTFKSVAVFVCIIWISSVISTVINFFFGNLSQNEPGYRKRIGSMMLLIRLVIWTLGFLVAVAAAGIPLDRLSFMLGALGIGIGFGLQNIVNNLVSGIIIAFERPIQVGDIIEVGNKKGTVKEIGVRSSKMKNSDGADIIIPNGDLLSQHLINWTMQDNMRRVEFLISLPYLTDLNAVQSIIRTRLLLLEGILQTPAPAVIIQSFTEKAIEIKVMCWVPDLTKAGSVRSNVMLDIYNSLLAGGIGLQPSNIS